MRAVGWIRASQAILFEASLMPAFVGTAAAIRAGAPFRPLVLGLILVSLIGIQAGANLFKGYYEGLERSAPAASSGSWFAFDSRAAIGLTRDPRTVLRIGYASFAIGIIAGLVLVAITTNLLLLAFGAVGAFLAWSYSSPPLKLSYRGVGEVPTFLAFGPVMTIGATVAFGGTDLGTSFLASLVLGFLSAAISFSRYFPNREEDRAKGKRTPVTILGVHRARFAYYGLLIAPLVVGVVWAAAGRWMVWPIGLVAFDAAVAVSFPRGEAQPRAYERAIGVTIAAHLAVGLILVVDLVRGL